MEDERRVRGKDDKGRKRLEMIEVQSGKTEKKMDRGTGEKGKGKKSSGDEK